MNINKINSSNNSDYLERLNAIKAAKDDFVTSNGLKTAKDFEDYLVEELDIDIDVFDENLEEFKTLMTKNTDNAENKSEKIEKETNKADEADEDNEEGDIGEPDETNEDNEEEKILEFFDKLFSSALIRDEVDADGDGKISDNEITEFLDAVKELDGDKNTLSMADITKKLEELAKANEEEAPQSELFPDYEPVQSISPSYSSPVSGGNYGSYGGGAVNSGSIMSDSNLQNLANAINGNDTKSLEEQKSVLQEEIETHRTNIENIKNGSSKKVQAAQKDMDDAKKVMDDAIEKDEKIDEETKEKIKEVEENLTQNASDITSKESEIAECKSSILSTEASISNLEGLLNSLESPSGKEEDKEKDAKLKARKAELESQIQAKKQELEKLNNSLETLNDELDKLNTKKDELKAERDRLFEEEMKDASPETKAAIEKYEQACENVEKVKSEELSAEQSALDVKLNEMNELEAKIEEAKNKKAESSLDFDFEENMTDSQKAELAQFKNNFEQNKQRYQAVADKTGIPAELIAALHWRESSGNFNTYMHNGDPLGSPTVHYPQGKLFYDWESSAIDALSTDKYGNVVEGDVNTYYDFAEHYNGLGYRNKGLASPYVWSGTTTYKGGKYVADGQFSASAFDKQLGVAVMLKSAVS